jgi:hypothetical protein
MTMSMAYADLDELERLILGERRPAPPPAEAWREVVEFVQTLGLFAQVDHRRPNVLRAGPPGFRHPAIAEAVELLGGWSLLCRADGRLYRLRDRFLKAYGQVVDASQEIPLSEQAHLVQSRRSLRHTLGLTRFEQWRGSVPGTYCNAWTAACPHVVVSGQKKYKK